MKPAKPIADVLERHLSVSDAGGRELGAPDEDGPRYLKALGLTPGAPEVPEAVVLGAFEEARRAGLDSGALFAIAQAYGRGIGRIASAEAEIVRRLVRAAPPDARAATLDEVLSRTLPLAARLLQALHQARLWSELEDALDDEALEEPGAAERTVALVDLVSSTRFLAAAGLAETEQMVDAIQEAGQECTAGRAVTPVKFVGDGVFLLGRDTGEVVLAALHAVAFLDGGDLPCRARGGLAKGPMVRRAGDYFGLTVNMAQRLVQPAPPGTLLAERAAVPELPPGIAGEEMTKELRGIPGPTACIALRWRR